MPGYVIRRLIMMVPVLLGISVIVFFIMALIPGDPAQAILGSYATAENLADLRRELGLDKPLVERYLVWLGNLLQGDFGRSYTLERPVIESGGAQERSIAWMILRGTDGYSGDLKHEYDFLDEHVKPQFERISGIASSNIYGGQERELQVIVDSDALAARKITIPEIMRALDVENKTISAGDFDEGKRRYIARTVGEYQNEAEVEQVIIKRVGGIPVRILF